MLKKSNIIVILNLLKKILKVLNKITQGLNEII